MKPVDKAVQNSIILRQTMVKKNDMRAFLESSMKNFPQDKIVVGKPSKKKVRSK